MGTLYQHNQGYNIDIVRWCPYFIVNDNIIGNCDNSPFNIDSQTRLKNNWTQINDLWMIFIFCCPA